MSYSNTNPSVTVLRVRTLEALNLYVKSRVMIIDGNRFSACPDLFLFERGGESNTCRGEEEYDRWRALALPGPDPLPWKPPLLRATQPPSSVPSCAVDFLAATTSGTRPSRFTKRTVSRLLLLVARRTRHYVVRASVYVSMCACVCV